MIGDSVRCFSERAVKSAVHLRSAILRMNSESLCSRLKLLNVPANDLWRHFPFAAIAWLRLTPMGKSRSNPFGVFEIRAVHYLHAALRSLIFENCENLSIDQYVIEPCEYTRCGHFTSSSVRITF